MTMSSVAPANRASSGQFVKGVSGNPKGRPKSQDEVTQLTRSLSIDAVHRLHHLMEHAESEQVQLSVANAILDRAYGKPKESKEIDINHASTTRKLVLDTLTDEQLEALDIALDATIAHEMKLIEGEAMEIE